MSLWKEDTREEEERPVRLSLPSSGGKLTGLNNSRLIKKRKTGKDHSDRYTDIPNISSKNME